MPLLFKLYQVNRTFSDGRQDNANGKWFARAIHIGEVGLKDLAKEVAYSTTATEADCLAVMNALVEVMKRKMAESQVVRLDGLGTFRAVIKSKGATDLNEFTIAENVSSVGVNFQAERKLDPTTRSYTKSLLNGVTVKETPKNDIGIEKA